MDVEKKRQRKGTAEKTLEAGRTKKEMRQEVKKERTKKKLEKDEKRNKKSMKAVGSKGH